MNEMQPDSTVRTTCPYCGVGCQMNLRIKDEQIYRVEAPFDRRRQFLAISVSKAASGWTCHPSAPIEEAADPRRRGAVISAKPAGTKRWNTSAGSCRRW